LSSYRANADLGDLAGITSITNIDVVLASREISTGSKAECDVVAP